MVTASPLLVDAESRMKRSVEALKKELTTIRTGRANPALVEHVVVDYFGTPTALNQIASIAAPDARLLTIQPWDKRALTAIEKAILRSELGLVPTNDGTVVRLALPPLTEERRKELARLVSRRAEEGRIGVRNTRRDAMEKLRTQERSKELSQDESRRLQEQVQKLADAFIAQVDELGKDKEKEVMGSG